GLRPSASEPGRTPMQESRDRASSDGRAPLVASLLESARTKGRKMLCASPDHQLVHVQAAVCGPQNRQYQTSGTTCRIRDYRCSWRQVIRLQARLLSRWLRGDVPVYLGITTR